MSVLIIRIQSNLNMFEQLTHSIYRSDPTSNFNYFDR